MLRPFAPNAVTDVTGFGLLGHAHEMAERSGVRIELDAAALPLFPGALEQARGRGSGPAATGGTATSPARTSTRTASPRSSSRSRTTRRPSGGLLISLPADKAPVLQAEFGVAEAVRAPRRTRRRGLGRRLAVISARRPAEGSCGVIRRGA